MANYVRYENTSIVALKNIILSNQFKIKKDCEYIASFEGEYWQDSIDYFKLMRQNNSKYPQFVGYISANDFDEYFIIKDKILEEVDQLFDKLLNQYE